MLTYQSVDVPCEVPTFCIDPQSDPSLRRGDETHWIKLNHQHTFSEQDAIEFAFPDELYNRDPEACATRAILCPVNKAVDALNDTIIQRMNGKEYTHTAFERFLQNDQQAGHHDEEFLAAQEESPKPPHKLQLKPGVVCLVLRNMSRRYELYNNEKVIYKGPRGEGMIEVKKVNGGASPWQTFVLPRINFTIQPRNVRGLKFNRCQYPVKPAYAETVHKSQGQTLEKIVIEIRHHFFQHGHLYTALTRVRYGCDMLLLTSPERICDGPPICRNIVYRKLLE
ncbi:unnamed protein product [Vitrella brassicaformis CCMP3155]|uniref:Uncharacterized protein n=1 Tax=Vitrella brassicaformis (strain CCMP3155) TaxID=1169540 RepID=A0A0G4EF11_VITBC|nr:unnamed protein product [Vitrella brassicaformis CCMP3155]|mmetsp:Transcript_35618/g.88613  ORF Transcript_35618/g.88613 Transcript_35618/m.88613 type:complete len:281 (-) Transcript_35618:119-961(-)|eukprot:CEL93981.1 unnamed protein product [Vitrella brassicaformis CCMP3155]